MEAPQGQGGTTHAAFVLRSSVHILQKGIGQRRRAKDPGPRVLLELPLVATRYVSYDLGEYDLRGAMWRLLKDRPDIGSGSSLESFVVDGAGDKVAFYEKQKLLTAAVAGCDELGSVFRRFVEEDLAPRLQREFGGRRVYYQCPPTVRIQCPGGAAVRAHADGDYGHQRGEINYWTPLSQCATTLWVAEEVNKNARYVPLEVDVGTIGVFHGSLLRHYVPKNETKVTRVSIDFRLAPGPYFDPEWRLRGTLADHERRSVEFFPPPPQVEDDGGDVCDLAVDADLAVAAKRLVETGVAVVRLPVDASSVFEALPRDISSTRGDPLHGFHSAKGLGGYNEFREGCVFQANRPVHDDAEEEGDDSSQDSSFAAALESFRRGVHDFAREFLVHLAEALLLEASFFETNDWDVVSASQCHVKRLVNATLGDVAVPAHVDPSLISLVVHGPRAGGLELLVEQENHHHTNDVTHESSSSFKRQPHFGPTTATIVAGSLLHLLTRRRVPACKHRVRPTLQADLRDRVAATFFFQPAPDAILRPFFPPDTDDNAEKKSHVNEETYAQWKARAYATYFRNNTKKKKKKKNTTDTAAKQDDDVLALRPAEEKIPSPASVGA